MFETCVLRFLTLHCHIKWNIYYRCGLVTLYNLIWTCIMYITYSIGAHKILYMTIWLYPTMLPHWGTSSSINSSTFSQAISLRYLFFLASFLKHNNFHFYLVRVLRIFVYNIILQLLDKIIDISKYTCQLRELVACLSQIMLCWNITRTTSMATDLWCPLILVIEERPFKNIASR
jgi:hypothetical protein